MKIYSLQGTCVCFQIGLPCTEHSLCPLLQSSIQPILLEIGDRKLYSDFPLTLVIEHHLFILSTAVEVTFLLSSILTGLFWACFNVACHS